MAQLPLKQNYVSNKSQMCFYDSDVNAPEERIKPRAAVIRVLLLFSLISIGWTTSSWCEEYDGDWDDLLRWSELVADMTASDVFNNNFDYDYIKSAVDFVFGGGNWSLTSEQIGKLKKAYKNQLRIQLNDLNSRADPPKSQDDLDALLDSAADMFEKALDRFKGE